jgi:energy-coupling factor transport system ATP-binding protein
MNTFQLDRVSYYYPEREKPALNEISLEIGQGEFVTLCGPSGCGKTTLLRQLKTSLAPHGTLSGKISFEGDNLPEVSQRTQASKIGFVFQNPENQIVTDKVWHELAFGLESLGIATPEIRLRVAEMASFFGIQDWFYKNVTELSGGQKQMLNLAAVMVLQPSVLILDEPTSQLDPIAASDFFAMLGRIHRELGTTIILTEHRLEEAFPVSDRIIVMEEGAILCKGDPKQVGLALKEKTHSMFHAMPTPMRIFAGVANDLECPVTVREGHDWLDKLVASRRGGDEKSRIKEEAESLQALRQYAKGQEKTPVIEMDEVWFKYKKDGLDVIKGLSLTVHKGEFVAIMGGNSTGKTTALSLISGIRKADRGRIRVTGSWAALPQNPQTLFVKKTVKEDLEEMLKERHLPEEVKKKKMSEVIELCRLGRLLFSHPYDLSGGEQQRAALAKVLLLEPDILLLDEPTKGFDGEFKLAFAMILKKLLEKGITILMVSHDLEFCAEHAQRCAMFFDGGIVSEGTPAAFFSGNSFYTTAANRMARHIFPAAITAKDVIRACGGDADPESQNQKDAAGEGDAEILENVAEIEDAGLSADEPDAEDGIRKFRIPLKRSVFSQPSKKNTCTIEQTAVESRKLTKRTKAAALVVAFIIPLTIFIGIYYFDDRKYYFISMLVLLEALLPFAMIFENRKPQARELVVIAVLCGIATAGRAAFFWAPQFKPVTAIVMISAVAFGGETGFLVGAITALVSNMFFGQGPWTPWQMFAFGTIGLLTGILFRKGILRSNRYALAIFGGLATMVIYGGIMNPASVLMFQDQPTKEMFYLAYLQGIPFDLVHAAATVFFLLAAAEPMLEKLERIKIKYGLIKS